MLDRPDPATVSHALLPSAGRCTSHSLKPAFIFFLVALLLIFARSIQRGFDVDENAFIASGAVLARHGLLPYRDYHYNHMPTELFVYAFLFRLSNHLVLIARIFQDICAAGSATALFVVAHGAFAHLGRRAQRWLAWAAGAMLLTNPLFTITIGFCWNHDFPLLMALLGFLSLRRGLQREQGHGLEGAPQRDSSRWGPLARATWTILAGILLGLAVTTRLTFAPACAGFVVLIGLWSGLSLGRRIRLCLLLGLGFAIAAIPSAWVWAQSPGNAFFGNFLYPRLNTRIHMLQDDPPKPYSTPAILWYWLKLWVTMPGNGFLTITFIVLTTGLLRVRAIRMTTSGAQLVSIACIVIMLTASGFMPRPPYPQYFYEATPFMLLAVILALAEITRRQIGFGMPLWKIVAGGFALTLAFGAPMYHGMILLPRPNRWVPNQVHQAGVQVARNVHSGWVLTIEPAFVLEGGLDIDPRFITSRFGLRVADFLTSRQRAQYLMPSPKDLPAMFDQPDPPAAVLIEYETDARIDGIMVRAAREHGYKEILLGGTPAGGHVPPQVWVRPKGS